MAEVNALLKQANPDASEAESGVEEGEGGVTEEGWNGIEEPAAVDGVDEYIDEDKYTTVTIETMDDPRDLAVGSEDEDGGTAETRSSTMTTQGKAPASAAANRKGASRNKSADNAAKKKKKKKKFRYESKAERKQTRQKQKAKNSAAAKVRRSG